ncbi:class III lanthipeptide [Kitasatospora sp. RG8]|nr:class III lanthipeptide [Kitasatospora sp. RG8]MBP0449123.1 class III lanthipeptide [Kitasatospora sp. RG8]
MSVLKLQNLQPVMTPARTAVLSLSSSSSDCCKEPTKPPVKD